MGGYTKLASGSSVLSKFLFVFELELGIYPCFTSDFHRLAQLFNLLFARKAKTIMTWYRWRLSSRVWVWFYWRLTFTFTSTRFFALFSLWKMKQKSSTKIYAFQSSQCISSLVVAREVKLSEVKDRDWIHMW